MHEKTHKIEDSLESNNLLRWLSTFSRVLTCFKKGDLNLKTPQTIHSTTPIFKKGVRQIDTTLQLYILC